jgi:hypothetical protein
VPAEKHPTLRIDVALVHYPVVNRNGETIGSAVTNLDLHDIARAGGPMASGPTGWSRPTSSSELAGQIVATGPKDMAVLPIQIAAMRPVDCHGLRRYDEVLGRSHAKFWRQTDGSGHLCQRAGQHHQLRERERLGPRCSHSAAARDGLGIEPRNCCHGDGGVAAPVQGRTTGSTTCRCVQQHPSFLTGCWRTRWHTDEDRTIADPTRSDRNR